MYSIQKHIWIWFVSVSDINEGEICVTNGGNRIWVNTGSEYSFLSETYFVLWFVFNSYIIIRLQRPFLQFCCPAGPDVFQIVGYYWRLFGSVQRSRGGVQTETSQQILAVHWSSFPGSLSHLHGKTTSVLYISSILTASVWKCHIELMWINNASSLEDVLLANFEA